MTFTALRSGIARAVEGVAVSVEQVGSTAVPGLAAKPIVDIDVVVRAQHDVPVAVERLAKLGYVHEGDLGITGREAFEAPPEVAAHHLYVVVAGSKPHLDHVLLRDRLRSHPEEASAYERVKRTSAARLPGNVAGYIAAKAELIEELLNRAHQTPTEPSDTA